MGWGAAIGAIGSALVSTLGSSIGNEYASKKNNERYKDTQRFLALNTPSWNVQGLRDAGLNPILAVNNGISSPQAVNTASTFSPDTSGIRDVINKMASAKQLDVMEAQEDKLSEETKVANATAEQVKQQTEKLAEETKALKRDNEHWDLNPNMYGVKKGNEALPGVGGVGALLEILTRDISNSAKSWDNEKRGEARVKKDLYKRIRYRDDY